MNDCLKAPLDKGQIYLDFHGKVSGYVRGKVADTYEAEDVVSSVFMKVYGRLDTFDINRASLSTWIYTITRSTVVDYYRKKKTNVEFADYMSLEEMGGSYGNDEEALDKLAEALLHLKEKERDVIVLHYYKGYTLKAIAEMMKMSYVNAKVLHKKALNCLYEQMQNKCN